MRQSTVIDLTSYGDTFCDYRGNFIGGFALNLGTSALQTELTVVMFFLRLFTPYVS